MSQRRRSRSRSTRARKGQEYPGWLWMLFGLSLGLSVAFAVHVKNRKAADFEPQARQQTASPQGSIDDNGARVANTVAAAE